MEQSQTVQKACDCLIDRVRYKNAAFTPPGPRRVESSKEYTDEIREATRLYVETWIVPVLEALKEGDTRRLREKIR